MNILKDINEVLLKYYNDLLYLIPKIIVGVLVTVIIYFIISSLNKKIIVYLNSRTDDKLMVIFIRKVFNISKVLLSILLFLYIIGLGGLATTIFGAATISSIVIGFAFKDIAENFLAGVIMAFNRPFRIGDVVKTEGVEGSIVSMSLRDTHIKTYDGKDVYVPNGQIIKNPLYNFTIDGFLRKSFLIGIDYGADIEAARRIIQETMTSIEGVLNSEKMPKNFISKFGPSTIEIEVQFWLDTFDKSYSGTEVQTQAMKQVLNNLEKNGISLPGDIIEIKNYQSSPLITNSAEIKKSA